MARIDRISVDALDECHLDEIRRAVRRERDTEAGKALSVAIMGQTGVGKSSLLNALFGTRLPVSDVKPATREPQEVTVPGNSGHMLTFWDMPGIAESDGADSAYTQMYLDKLAECDVVIWAAHADSRSTAYDADRLNAMLAHLDPAARRRIVSRLTFVLTKADTLTPPPWIFDMRGRRGSFVPSPPLAARLERKAAGFEQTFIAPWHEHLTATTYNTGGFTVSDEKLSFDKHTVRYRGHFSQQVYERYSSLHPRHVTVFSRLRDNHRVLPCSSLFRYNLVRLMLTVVNKLEPAAVFRFQRMFDDIADLAAVHPAAMLDYANFLVWDGARGVEAFGGTNPPL